MKRRTLLQAIPAATILLAPSLFAFAVSRDNDMPTSPDSTGVYELRIYHVSPGKMQDLLARFRDHTDAIFKRHGMHSVAYWTPLDEPDKSNTLIYILHHPSRDEATANWNAFQDDPEWKSVKEKSEVNGKLTEKIDSTFMALTDFSARISGKKS
jgi:NIPSNAP